MKVYFAGPLFTIYEREYISRCAAQLREYGLDPFVPHENYKPPQPDDKRSVAKRCLDKDFAAISEANAMLALINGTEVDDGTAAEIGIFYALGLRDPSKKGIVALHDDWRTKENGEGKPLNLFVAGCLEKGGAICHSLDEALRQLQTWQAELQQDGYLPKTEAGQ
jgi:hypothetical protein